MVKRLGSVHHLAKLAVQIYANLSKFEKKRGGHACLYLDGSNTRNSIRFVDSGSEDTCGNFGSFRYLVRSKHGSSSISINQNAYVGKDRFRLKYHLVRQVKLSPKKF